MCTFQNEYRICTYKIFGISNFIMKNVNLRLPGTSWTSEVKLMYGSWRLKSAQDLLLKLTPWKQAREIVFPCNSREPPRTVPEFGKGRGSVVSRRPDTRSRTPCQCRWWRASCPEATPSTEKLYTFIYRHILKWYNINVKFLTHQHCHFWKVCILRLYREFLDKSWYCYVIIIFIYTNEIPAHH